MPYALLKTGSLFFHTADSTAKQKGKGRIIFIHGAGGDHQRWVRQLEPGFPGWMLAAIDLPGHGASAGVPSERVADYAETLKELIKGYGFPRPRLLVGHSMGGNIALQAALDHPGLVDGLVLIGSGARMTVNPKMLEQLSRGTFDTSFLKIAYSPDAPPEFLISEMELWSRSSQQQLYIDFTACNNFDVSEKLGSLTLPVLILVGDQDKMTPVKSSQFLHQNIAGSEFRIIPGAGHHLMLEKPMETNQAIQEFLDKKFA